MPPDLQHVIAAAGIHEAAVAALDVLVAGARPRAEKSAARPFAVVPVAGGAARTGDLQLALLAAGHEIAFIVHQPNGVAGHRTPGGAVPHLARPIGDENMQHFRRADAVQDVDAEAPLPAAPDIFGQWFSAEMQRRSPAASTVGNSALASMAAYSVGTPQKIVGRCFASCAKTAAGVGRCAMRTVVAPTASGKVREFPSPYAKNSLAAEKHTSLRASPRMGRA